MRRTATLLSVIGLGVPILAPVATAQHADFADVVGPAMDSVFMLGVVRQVEGKPEAFQSVGTGWIIADGKIATNAHVAQALLEYVGEGRLVAKRGWSDRDEITLNPQGILIHPAYGPWNARLKRVVVRNEYNPDTTANASFIPVADVAIIDVEAGMADKPLTLADPSDEPALSEPVVYIGFPSENISGFPTVHVVPGYITAKTDFFFTKADWEDSYLLHYCGPVVGGASGSPILNADGKVIGIISAAEHNMVGEETRMSFGFAYGQRVDLARELLSPDYLDVQSVRNREWSERMSELLIPPQELLANLAREAAVADGVPSLTATNTVTRREITLSGADPFTMPVTLEPGLKYGFLAAAHDGTDIDAKVTNRADEVVLSSDTMFDYFPVVWVGPLAERTQVSFEIYAGEGLLQATACTVQIYKYTPVITTPAVDEREANEFFDVVYTVPIGLAENPSWSFSVSGDTMYQFSGLIVDQHDIDMVLYYNGVEVVADRLGDNVPVVTYTTDAAGGEIRIELIVPPTVPAGSTIALDGAAPLGGPHGVLTSFPEGSADAAEPFESDGPTPTLSGPISDEQLWIALENTYVADAAEAGLTIDIAYQERFAINPAVNSARELTYTIPANTEISCIAIAPRGEDIDIATYDQNSEALVSDFKMDNNPIVFIESEPTARTITIRITTSQTNPVDPVAFRILTLHR